MCIQKIIISREFQTTGEPLTTFTPKCDVCDLSKGKWEEVNGEKRFCCSTCGYAFTPEELNPFSEDIRIERMKAELDLLKLQKKRIKLEISRKRLAIGSLREALTQKVKQE